MRDTTTHTGLQGLASELAALTDFMMAAANGGHVRLDLRPALKAAVHAISAHQASGGDDLLEAHLQEICSNGDRALAMCGSGPALFGAGAFHVCSAALKAQRRIGELIAAG